MVARSTASADGSQSRLPSVIAGAMIGGVRRGGGAPGVRPRARLSLPRWLGGQVVMLDRAASAGLANQCDQGEVGEPADVIRGHAQRRVELIGELSRAGLPLTQHLEDARAERMGERLAKALVLDVVVSAQAAVPLSGTPYVRARGRTATLAVSRKVDH